MSDSKKPVRAWVDGCFDMMHFGHANALRQAKQLCDYLIVGVHSDSDIEKNKGPPVMNEKERYMAVRACKWVDEVVEAAPYTTELAYLEKYNCDFVVHGDDLVVNADGKDCYEEVKKAGKFRTVPRTEGVSTTDLVGRMLLLSRESQQRAAAAAASEGRPCPVASMAASPFTRVTRFVPSSHKIVQFSEGQPERCATDRVVYVDGGFDLFHVGHTEFLRVAREQGTYLIVGIHTDQDINTHKGANHPIMTLQERVLGVLSCRYVDEVIIGAPYSVTADMISSLGIALVCSGVVGCDDPTDSYAEARRRGIWRQIASPLALTSSDVINRILANYAKYAERNRKKEAREVASLEPAEKKNKTNP